MVAYLPAAQVIFQWLSFSSSYSAYHSYSASSATKLIFQSSCMYSSYSAYFIAASLSSSYSAYLQVLSLSSQRTSLSHAHSYSASPTAKLIFHRTSLYSRGYSVYLLVVSLSFNNAAIVQLLNLFFSWWAYLAIVLNLLWNYHIFQLSTCHPNFLLSFNYLIYLLTAKLICQLRSLSSSFRLSATHFILQLFTSILSFFGAALLLLFLPAYPLESSSLSSYRTILLHPNLKLVIQFSPT
jgi:hypothetical protein